MKDRVELFATRAEWEAARGNARIGASIVGDILSRPWDALATLTGASTPSAADRRRFERGHRFEAAVLEQYADETGDPMLPAGDALGSPGALVIVRHPTEEWATCSPDGLTTDLARVGEAKSWGTTAGIAREDITVPSMEAYDPATCPQYIAAQAYWQLEVTQAELVAVAFLLGGFRLRVIRFMPDAAAQRAMLNQVGEWRERHIIRGEPLPVDGSDACGSVVGRYLPQPGGTIEPTPEIAEIIRERIAAQRLRDEAAAIAEAHETTMKLCDAAILTKLRDLAAVSEKKPTGTVSVVLPGEGKWYAYPVAGRQSVAVSELRKHPALYDAIVAQGLLSTSAPYVVAKTTLPKE